MYLRFNEVEFVPQDLAVIDVFRVMKSAQCKGFYRLANRVWAYLFFTASIARTPFIPAGIIELRHFFVGDSSQET